MKARALIGFTFVDAILWLADECRERGCAMMVHADGRTATMRDAVFSILPFGEVVDPAKFDEIIDRREMAA